MSDYFEIPNKLDEVIQLRKVSECLKEKLKAMEAKFNALQPSTEEESSQSLLTRMMNQAIKQAGKMSKKFPKPLKFLKILKFPKNF